MTAVRLGVGACRARPTRGERSDGPTRMLSDFCRTHPGHDDLSLACAGGGRKVLLSCLEGLATGVLSGVVRHELVSWRGKGRWRIRKELVVDDDFGYRLEKIVEGCFGVLDESTLVWRQYFGFEIFELVVDERGNVVFGFGLESC